MRWGGRLGEMGVWLVREDDWDVGYVVYFYCLKEVLCLIFFSY
jgi:hypothetical protein